MRRLLINCSKSMIFPVLIAAVLFSADLIITIIAPVPPVEAVPVIVLRGFGLFRVEYVAYNVESLTPDFFTTISLTFITVDV